VSLQNLEEHGVLLPEDEWGDHSLESTVSKPWLLLAFVVAVASLLGVWSGQGGSLTWVSLGGFLVGLLGITIVCDRAVARQRERSRTERRKARETRS
jgi:hypothetical protein